MKPRKPVLVLPSRNKHSLLARVFGDKPKTTKKTDQPNAAKKAAKKGRR